MDDHPDGHDNAPIVEPRTVSDENNPACPFSSPLLNKPGRSNSLGSMSGTQKTCCADGYTEAVFGHAKKCNTCKIKNNKPSHPDQQDVNSKRKASPSLNNSQPKKSKNTFVSLASDIDSQDWEELSDRLLEAIDLIKVVDQECNSLNGELASTKSSFDRYRIAFADKMFTSIWTHPIIQHAPGPVSQNQPNHASTLIISTSDNATDMDLKELDAILGSAEKGPVTETFSKKGNIVYASYKSALESGRAKAILEAKPNLVRTIHTKDIFYPAIALNINVSDLPTLHNELVLRNDFIGSSLKKIIPSFKSKVNPEVGHVKLFFDSAPTRTRIIERQNVSAFGRKFHAVELDWNREVRRCFNCKHYGHVTKTCIASAAWCGWCASDYDTRSCTSQDPPSCCHCKGKHSAGDPLCAEQIKAVKRLRSRTEQCCTSIQVS
ncbi:hypothetical protein DAPPUDRAFT_246757 [Daphnia pulex]|uniref:CCHC-type domain-containing protein n=1 Tax=Daphnia pulex TaxID=6669 RepID=E9GR64_DAPPU|nr:hypothetical protein DAPPUDRAFT_246757 [Daphnia pulex]|eukprot:EFX77953.1 hypothetical protein DAPPUDRAFT_246757 [Daphnia pulex]